MIVHEVLVRRLHCCHGNWVYMRKLNWLLKLKGVCQYSGIVQIPSMNILQDAQYLHFSISKVFFRNLPDTQAFEQFSSLNTGHDNSSQGTKRTESDIVK